MIFLVEIDETLSIKHVELRFSRDLREGSLGYFFSSEKGLAGQMTAGHRRHLTRIISEIPKNHYF